MPKDLLSDKERERFANREKAISNRLMSGAAGVAVSTSALPLIAKSLSPAPVLFHGTSMEAGDKIFNQPVDGQRGLLTRFAGRAGRLNEKLLSNAAVASLERQGMKLSDSDIVELVVDTNMRIAQVSAASKVGKAVTYDAKELVQGAAEDFLRRRNVPADQVARLTKQLDQDLTMAGKRIYFGWHPSTVAAWGDEGNELSLFAQKHARAMMQDPKWRASMEEALDKLLEGRPPGMPKPAFPWAKLQSAPTDAGEVLGGWLATEVGPAAAEQVLKNKLLHRMDDATAVGPLVRDLLYKLPPEARRALQDAGIDTYKVPLSEGSSSLWTFTDSVSAATSGYMGKATGVKKQMAAVFHLMTFGIVPEVQSVGKALAYRPADVRHVTLDELAKVIAHESSTHGSAKSLVIGATVPGGDVRWMTDFPGLSTALKINPGLKHTIADFLPNYEPSRDISVHQDVPATHFSQVDIIDKATGKFTRYKIGGAGRPAFGPLRYLKGLGRLVPTLAIGAFGADLTQAAIRGEKTFTAQALRGDLVLRPTEKDPGVKRWQLPFGIEKAASPALRAAGNVAKHTVPVVLMGGAAGIGIEKAMQHLMPVDRTKDMSQVEAEAYLMARETAAAPITMPAALAAAILAGPKDAQALKSVLSGAISGMRGKSPNAEALRPLLGRAARSYGKLLLATTAVGGALTAATQTRRGVPPGAISPLNLPLESKKGQQLLDRAPWATAVPTLALTAAALPGLVYVARKHYPGHALQAASVLEAAQKGVRPDQLGAWKAGRASARDYLASKGLNTKSSLLDNI